MKRKQPKGASRKPRSDAAWQEKWRCCAAAWLQRLERGETVVVNLRPDTEVETEFVRFDRLRVLRVLERIAADLDDLSRLPNDAHADKESNPRDARARHRHELAEPPREPKTFERLSAILQPRKLIT